MSKYVWLGGLVFLLCCLRGIRASVSAPNITSGAPLPPMTPEQLGEVEQLARAGDKISAIKLYRKLTGVGLKEAKEAVENLVK
jgi:ribosomal protein L7/L12